MRAFVVLLLLAAGCDSFLIDNPSQCVLSPSACSGDEYCSLVTRTCRKARFDRPLARASRSSTIALSDDGGRIAVVRPDAGSLALLSAANLGAPQSVAVGKEPQAVVLHPDGRSAFVTNRADATVVQISGIDGGAPAVSAPIGVGAEPSGLALSPTGALLFVAEYAQGRVSVIDTEAMQVVATIADVRSPRALAVTSNGDRDDSDELLVVPEFFGELQEGAAEPGLERRGRVHLYRLSGLDPALGQLPRSGTIALEPLSGDEAGFGEPAAPNQLAALAIEGRRLLVTSLSVSPGAPLSFDHNVNPVLYVALLPDPAGLTADAPLADLRGPLGTISLARAVLKDTAHGVRAEDKRFLADPVAVDFVPDPAGPTGVAYVVARGARLVQRVAFDDMKGTLGVGSMLNLQITLESVAGRCDAPAGIAVKSREGAFVHCGLGDSVATLDLRKQELQQVTPLGQAQADTAALRGRRLFYSAVDGRLSQQGWSSCASCHPDGLSDGVSWRLADGPRQTVSLDGTFAHAGDDLTRQRVLGWSASADEIHDFERLLRATTAAPQGGLIRRPVVGSTCADQTEPVPLPAEDLDAISARGLQLDPMSCRGADGTWEELREFIRTIRPARGRAAAAAVLDRGRALFREGLCHSCHGGPTWTLSRVTFDASMISGLLLAPARCDAQNTRLRGLTQITPGGAGQPRQVACVLRAVGTKGTEDVVGDLGFNVPPLLGLALGAPYLHDGKARTLADLGDHLQAGDANFLVGASAGADRQALFDFLLSIDSQTPFEMPPADTDCCN